MKDCVFRVIAFANSPDAQPDDFRCTGEKCAQFIQTPRSFGCCLVYLAETLIYVSEKLAGGKRPV